MGLFGSILGGIGSSKAAKKQAAAAAQALALQKQIYDESRVDNKPYMDFGSAGVSRLGTLLGVTGDASADGYGSLSKKFTMDDYQEDPGYKFRLSEGEKGINRGLASRGNYFSGSALKSLNRFNSDQASQEYGNAYNRFNADNQNLYNRLMGSVGVGQQANNTVGNAGQNYANQGAEYITQRGNAQAAGTAGLWGGLANGVSSLEGLIGMGSINPWAGASSPASVGFNSIYGPTQPISWNSYGR